MKSGKLLHGFGIQTGRHRIPLTLGGNKLCLYLVLLISSTVLLALVSGCRSEPTPAGYWEGKGTATEIPMDDAVRTLTREADFEF